MIKKIPVLIVSLFLSLILFHNAMASGPFIQDAKEEGCRDTDKDGICDNIDNCPEVANPDQEDLDYNGVGDACECMDGDKDGVCDDVDNCPEVANSDQADADHDGIGDACDDCLDGDRDGICDDSDNCPKVANPDQADTDLDGIGDACDSCIDVDRDSICDASDNCPGVANPDQMDTDRDGMGDACDQAVIAPIPVGQSEKEDISGQGQVDADVFGTQGGYLHPFLLLDERWTDNLYSTSSNEEEELITTISPGLWLALPANREKLLEISTTTTAPGGLKISRQTPETVRKFQSYLYYSPEFKYYANNSQHDTVNHKLEGLFQYNLDMGLSIDIIDQYNIADEPYYDGRSERIDEYQDNLFNTLLYYETPERFKFRFDFSNYDLNFKDQRNNYRERDDDSYALYAFYRIKPKTSIFLEYEFADIEYDVNTDSDSTENRYYAGLQWDVTEKTSGSVKFGYMKKDFDNGDAFDDDDFSAEIQLQHNFTPKRGLSLIGFRRYNESAMIESPSFLTTGFTAAWLQRFTDKWSGTLQCSYAKDEYKRPITIGGGPVYREDEIFSISPALRFKPRDWFVFDLGYLYMRRDSNFDILDFTANTIFFKVNFNI